MSDAQDQAWMRRAIGLALDAAHIASCDSDIR